MSYHTLSKTLAVLLLVLSQTTVFGQNPVANFTSNVTSGCAPLTVSFTDQSTGNPISWNWEFSNGTLSSVRNPVVTFSTPGTYSVKLVVRSATGIAQIERINYITVFPSPFANFNANLTLGCVPTTINFTDASTPAGGIVSWEWDFGDGGTSTLQNPSHTYNNEGFYTVALTVTSTTGCKNTRTRGNYIRIVGAISTDFTFTPPLTCRAPFLVNFQNQSSGPGTVTYNWTFGNSQTSTAFNPTASYNTPGTYTVRLNAQSNLGCTGSIQKTITIGSTATDFIAPADICLNQPVTFQNNSSSAPVGSTWSFGDGTVSAQINPIKTYLAPGVYTVKLINQYSSCRDSITKTVTVDALPVVDITVNDSSYCQAPANVQFTNTTAGAVSWQWDFGDGGTSTLQNPSHQYTTLGNYTVTLTVVTSSGCTNTIIKPDFIEVQEIAIALNVPDGGCIPFTYTPVAVISTLDTIASYSWNLGEPGAVFNVRNPPPYTYTTAGSFDISLTVTSVAGCTKTITIPNGIRTGVPPIVSFTASPLNACASQLISFTNTSITTPGAEVIWQWDFGDGTGLNSENPQHIFVDTGALTVRLVVLNNRCPAEASQVLQVRPPVAGFIYNLNCTTKTVTFTDTSLVNPGLTPLTYLWEMGDPANTQFTTQNPPPFTYPGPGSYTVRLTVTNGPCSYVRGRTIVIADEIADFTIDKNPVCKGDLFTLSAINMNTANIRDYEWTIGSHLFITSTPTISDTIKTNGNYDVSLRIRDFNGCTSIKTVPNYLTINGPVARFAPANPGACLNKTFTFNDLSTPAGGISNWHFNFGDGVQQDFSAPPFTHTYTRLGTFPVILTVRDAAGCSDTYLLPLPVRVTDPRAGFRADTFYCPNAALQFADTSSGAGLSYVWSFGDGNTSTLANPQNSYPAADADYSVQLIVTDISGCSDTAAKPNYIKIRSPKSAFGIKDTTTICPPLRTEFTFLGSDYQSFVWDFGDGGTSTTPNSPFYHFYSSFGTFTPQLILRGPGGCADTARSSVTIHDPSNIRINYGPVTTACNSLNVDFDIVIPPGFKFIFYFGDGSSDSTRRTSLSHFYSKPSLNRPYLIVFDSISGCSNTILGNPRIDVLGAIPLFGADKTAFCDTGTVRFTDFTTKNEPIISTVWNFGDGFTSSAQNPVHTYTQPGTYIIRLDVTTQSNCSNFFTDTVLVYRTPAPSIVSRDTVCVNIADPFGGTIAVPDSVTNWQWNFGNGQTSTQQNNSITYNTAGDYTIQLITSNKLGCRDTATKRIHVAALPTVTAVQDPLTIPAGGSTSLQMTYTGNITSYNWTPQYRLNCFNCPLPVANPQSTTKYNVQVQDAYGCRNSGEITVVVVCNNQNFFIPNTFSPNGDGRNEAFFPRGTGIIRIKSFTIFNRIGQVVFDRKDFVVNDPSKGWDGTFKGQKASADVYVYMMELLCDNNTVIPVKGNVTLLR